MGTFSFSLFLLFLTASAAVTTATVATQTNTFIKSKCSTTTYPKVCVETLSSYARTIQKSPHQMAQTALTVSLTKARNAKTYMAQLRRTKGLRPKEVGVLKDCMEEIGDTVNRLGMSAHELQMAVRSRPREFRWRMSNVLTWASAALTDLNTCGDEVKGLNRKIKSSVMSQIQGVMQCTSNALALVNQIANQ